MGRSGTVLEGTGMSPNAIIELAFTLVAVVVALVIGRDVVRGMIRQDVTLTFFFPSRFPWGFHFKPRLLGARAVVGGALYLIALVMLPVFCIYLFVSRNILK